MEERQNADSGNSGASQQGNQSDKDANTQGSSNQPEKRSRSSVPQYGRHDKRQYPHRGAGPNKEKREQKEQDQNKEQAQPKEQTQNTDQDTAREQSSGREHREQGSGRTQDRSQEQTREQSRQQQQQSGERQTGERQPTERQTTDRQQTGEKPSAGEKQSNNNAVNKIVPPKGPKKVPYNNSRYRGKQYTPRDQQSQASGAPASAVLKKTSFRKISIIVPLLNEEESLRPLANEIKKVMRTVAADFEVILIDDGSTDKSLKIIKEIARFDPKFKYISFRKNYGKSAALQVGFKQAAGDAIITMDADLQDDPNEIPNLIQKLEEGYDLVSGWKKERFDPFIKRHSSKFFNYVTGVMSGIDIHDFNCGLKAYRKDVVKDIKVYGELHRYMPVLADWQGYRISEIPVKHHPRRYGKTKFGISRFFKGFIDLVTVMFTTRYVKRPMHLFGFLGAIAFLIGFLVNGYLSVEWMMGKSLSNRPLLFFGMLLIIVGIQFFSVGLLGELMVHNFQSDKEYSIKDKG